MIYKLVFIICLLHSAVIFSAEISPTLRALAYDSIVSSLPEYELDGAEFGYETNPYDSNLTLTLISKSVIESNFNVVVNKDGKKTDLTGLANCKTFFSQNQKGWVIHKSSCQVKWDYINY